MEIQKEYSWNNFDNKDKLYWRELAVWNLGGNKKCVGDYTARELENRAYFLFELKALTDNPGKEYIRSAKQHLKSTDIIEQDNLVGFWGLTDKETKLYKRAIDVLVNGIYDDFELPELELLEPEWDIRMIEMWDFKEIKLNNKKLFEFVKKYFSHFPNLNPFY